MMHEPRRRVRRTSRIETELDAYGRGGFFDAVAVKLRDDRAPYLSLDQAMVMGAVGNVLPERPAARRSAPPGRAGPSPRHRDRAVRRGHRLIPRTHGAPGSPAGPGRATLDSRRDGHARDSTDREDPVHPVRTTTHEGVAYRDLNKNGRLDPYEDPRRRRRAGRGPARALTLEEKAGLMFHTVSRRAPTARCSRAPGSISKSPTSGVVRDKHLTHFNVHALDDARMAARWHNALQALAEEHAARHPRHALDRPAARLHRQPGASFAAGVLAVARAARPGRDGRRGAGARVRRHRPAGVLSPSASASPCTRWSTSRPSRAGRAVRHLRRGRRARDRLARRLHPRLPGERSARSVACMTKHFPGGGPQKDGEDPHFPYGREQVYPGGSSTTT